MEQVNLNRQVFNKEKFNETIDTSFSQLGPQQPDPSFFDTDLATVEDFFTLYDKFFFEIPKEGQTNSHTYLITESTEYVGFQQNQEEIQALLQEIADLREENLTLRQENVQLIQERFDSSPSSPSEDPEDRVFNNSEIPLQALGAPNLSVKRL